MKIDIYSEPPPLTFGAGDDSFKIKLHRCTDGHRARVFDALVSGSYGEIQSAVSSLIAGWEGVNDTAGNPLPFEGVGSGGKTVRNLPAFLGAISPDLQLQVATGVLKFVGIPAELVNGAFNPIRSVFGAPEEDTIGPDPTDKPAASM